MRNPHATRTGLFRITGAIAIATIVGGCVTSSPQGHVSPPRILLAGDSWPLLMRFHRGFQRALIEEGYRMREVRHVAIGWSIFPRVEAKLSSPGVHVEDYRDRYLDKLYLVLEQYPTIDVIHLTLGGADLLHELPAGISPIEQETFIREEVLPPLDDILARLQERYPDKHIALVGYDFVNLWDTQDTNARTYERWKRLGKPDPVELNAVMWRFNLLQSELARRHPNVTYIDYMGQTKERLARRRTLWEANPQAGLWKDGMHLSSEGNRDLARYCLDVAYRDWIMPLRDSHGRVIEPRKRTYDREPRRP